jgi:hypothetical protein
LKNTIKKFRIKEESKIKLSQVLEGSEITKPVLEALSPVFNPLIGEIVEKYDRQLHQNGQYMTPEEKRRLVFEIKNDMIIKLNLSINLTKKKMETWEIFPKSEKQTELNFEGETQAQIEELKQGAYFEVEGINQGEGEDIPADQEGAQEDQEGEGQVPEGQLRNNLLDIEGQEKEYNRRKKAYKKREAAVPLQ